MADIATRIAKAKETAARTQQMRADANSAITFARAQLTAIDGELATMGIKNPEDATTELAALEGQLERDVTAIEEQLRVEEQALQQILDLARQARIIQ